MHFLDLTLLSLPEQLACDEILLTGRESGDGGAVLRFWEPESYCVVVGYGNNAASEVRLDVCLDQNIPVYRRSSGGGTVVQGPGCLNFSLILPLNADPRFGTTGGTNEMVMRRHAAALQPLVHEPIDVRGFSDLTIASRKFSGNAQRRLQRYLLFHGCFLLDLDLPIIDALLPLPSKQPGYRADRSHSQFLRNLNIPASDVREAIRVAWGADKEETDSPRDEIRRLADERYTNPAWTFRVH